MRFVIFNAHLVLMNYLFLKTNVNDLLYFKFPYRKKTNATNTFHNYPQDDSILNKIDEKLTDSALGDSIVVSITIFFLQPKHISITYNYIFITKGINIFISPFL